MTSKPANLPNFNNLEEHRKVNKCRFGAFCLLLDAPKLHLLLVPMSLPLNHLPYLQCYLEKSQEKLENDKKKRHL